MSILTLHEKSQKNQTAKKVKTEKAITEKGTDSSSREEVERVAYEIYLQNGCEDGHCEEHWFQAERLVLGMNQKEIEEPKSDDEAIAGTNNKM